MNVMNHECLDGKGDNAIKGVQVKVMHLIKGVKYKMRYRFPPIESNYTQRFLHNN